MTDPELADPETYDALPEGSQHAGFNERGVRARITVARLRKKVEALAEMKLSLERDIEELKALRAEDARLLRDERAANEQLRERLDADKAILEYRQQNETINLLKSKVAELEKAPPQSEREQLLLKQAEKWKSDLEAEQQVTDKTFRALMEFIQLDEPVQPASMQELLRRLKDEQYKARVWSLNDLRQQLASANAELRRFQLESSPRPSLEAQQKAQQKELIEQLRSDLNMSADTLSELTRHHGNVLEAVGKLLRVHRSAGERRDDYHERIRTALSAAEDASFSPLRRIIVNRVHSTLTRIANAVINRYG